jgi:hypothetical protein
MKYQPGQFAGQRRVVEIWAATEAEDRQALEHGHGERSAAILPVDSCA